MYTLNDMLQVLICNVVSNFLMFTIQWSKEKSNRISSCTVGDYYNRNQSILVSLAHSSCKIVITFALSIKEFLQNIKNV